MATRTTSRDFSLPSLRRAIENTATAGPRQTPRDTKRPSSQPVATIEVFPFDHDGTQGARRCASALPEPLTQGLHAMPGLAARAREETESRVAAPDTFPTRYELEGSVHGSGDADSAVRVTVRLTRQPDGGDLWTGDFAGAVDRPVDLQATVVGGTADGVLGAITDACAHTARDHAYLYFNGAATTRPRRAQEALNQARALSSSRRSVQLADVCCLYWLERDFDGAADRLQTLVDEQPDDAETLAMSGFVERRRGAFDVALGRFERAFSITPTNVTLAESLAETHVAMREHGKADHWFGRTLALAPHRVGTVGLRVLNQLFWKACPAGATNASDCSLAHARRALDEPPYRDDPRLFVINFLLRIYETNVGSDPAEAWDAVGAYLETAPTRQLSRVQWLLTFWRRVMIYRHLGRDAEANKLLTSSIEDLNALISAAPRFGLYHAFLGVALTLSGRIEEGVDACVLATHLSSDDSFSGPYQRQLLAVALVQAEEHERATETLATLLAIPFQQAITKTQIILDPIWQPLRSSVAFQQLIQPRINDG